MDDKKQGNESEAIKPDILAAEKPEVTRAEVAKLLGVSVFKVRTMERAGELRPRKAPDGTRFFALVEIKAIAQALTAPRDAEPDAAPAHRGRAMDPRTDGEIAAELFRLFEEGKTLSEIVQQAGVVPKKVRELFSEWSVSLEAGENQRRRQSQAQADEREAERQERESKEHLKRMTEMEHEIARQQVEDERAARASAPRRRAPRIPSATVDGSPPPAPSQESPVQPGLEVLVSTLLDKLKGGL